MEACMHSLLLQATLQRKIESQTTAGHSVDKLLPSGSQGLLCMKSKTLTSPLECLLPVLRVLSTYFPNLFLCGDEVDFLL